MPGNPPSTSTEAEALLAYLVQQRDGLKYAAFGLTEEQLRGAPTRSALSVGALMKHAVVTERGWIDILRGRPSMGEDAYTDSFALSDADSVESLSAGLDRMGEETAAAVAELDGMDVRIQLPAGPWYPQDPDGFQARWILLHLVEELARHAGHADIVREHIDGATMFELMAGAEGWPENEWIKPWRPRTG